MKNPLFVKILFAVLNSIGLSGLMSSPISLIAGFLFTLNFGQPFPYLIRKGIQYLLKISVVGLGFGMYLMETLKTGKEGLILTVLTLSLTLVAGWFIAKLLKMEKHVGHLISSGTAICGGSAIAAVSPVIRAKPQAISVALGVIFLLNSIALIIFPAIGHWLHMTQQEFGIWAAVAIHDTSSVVGASMIYGEEALRVATTVKLARTLWIIPVSLISMFLFRSKGEKIKIPWFILYFIIAILLNSYFNLPELFTSTITTISKRFLIVTLFLIGNTLSIADLKAAGIKPFFFGVLLWILISLTSLFYLMW